ncbi:hypothetical protein BGZ99_001782, partial [Dissophora globulifera]
GSDEKVEFLLKEVGFDHAFNYKTRPTREALSEFAPKGIDIYFENVGGETLEAAIDHLNVHGRIIACGMISQYNTTKPYGIKNLTSVVGKRLTIRGFIVADFQEQYFEDFFRDVKALLLENKIVYRVDEAKGVEAAPDAFVGVLKGKNFGKQVVQVADLPSSPSRHDQWQSSTKRRKRKVNHIGRKTIKKKKQRKSKEDDKNQKRKLSPGTKKDHELLKLCR